MRCFATLAALGFLLAVTGTAGAKTVVFAFDPNDWITNYSTDVSKTRLEQDNPRLLIDGVPQDTDRAGYEGRHTTYKSNTDPEYGSTGIEGYANRVTSVEIHDFNMWLADGLNAPNWGEVLVQREGGSDPSGTATNGWTAYTFDNPWPQAGYGTKLVGWYDTAYYDDDPATTPVPLTFGSGGIDFGTFTLTVDLDTNDIYGNPVDLSVGTQHTVWLGAMLPVEWTSDPDDLVYSGNRRFEGTMKMTVVPEPVTLAGLGLGVGSLVTYLRRRRRT